MGGLWNLEQDRPVVDQLPPAQLCAHQLAKGRENPHKRLALTLLCLSPFFNPLLPSSSLTQWFMHTIRCSSRHTSFASLNAASRLAAAALSLFSLTPFLASPHSTSFSRDMPRTTASKLNKNRQSLARSRTSALLTPASDSSSSNHTSPYTTYWSATCIPTLSHWLSGTKAPSTNALSYAPPIATFEKCKLDISSYPDIFERIAQHADHDTLLALRCVNRFLRNTADRCLFDEVLIVDTGPRFKGANRGLGFISATEPHRLLPCIPSTEQYPTGYFTTKGWGLPTPRQLEDYTLQVPMEDEQGNVGKLAAHRASSRRMLGYVSVFDSAAKKLLHADHGLSYLATSPLPGIMRKAAHGRTDLPAAVVVDTVSFNGDGVGYPVGPYRHYAMGTSPQHAYVVHFTYDANFAPGAGVILSSMNPPNRKVRTIVFILPDMPHSSQWDMSPIVDGLKKSIAQALNLGTYARKPDAEPLVILVGVERFGPRYFGVEEQSEDLAQTFAAVKHSLLHGSPARPQYHRSLHLLTWDRWDNGHMRVVCRDGVRNYNTRELLTPPPHVPLHSLTVKYGLVTR